MKSPKRPINVLERCIMESIMWAWAFESDRLGYPGAVIEKLSPEDRELLQHLRAEDTMKMRWEHVPARLMSKYRLKPEYREGYIEYKSREPSFPYRKYFNT